MSFDVFIQCFNGGMPSGVPEADIRAILGSALQDVEDARYWQVTYGEYESTFYVGRDKNDPTQVHSITVNRPIDDLRLWGALYQIMLLGYFVLYFPGGRCPLTARQETTSNLPNDMIDVLGVPELVETGDDIVEAIKTA